MNMRKKAAAACLAMTLIFAASCSADNTERTETVSEATSEAISETTSEAVSETSTASAENIEEVSYMEKYKDIISEMPIDGITEKREGAAYPEFQKLMYYSQTAERDTPVNVLLPSDYSEEKEYPVLYILHGYFDNEDWMAREIVHIPEMLTNLIADGEAKEMIVVLPYIYCSKDMPRCTGMDTTNTLNYDNFINDMMTDLIPFIEENFSVAKGRENTAITGFSMGGREALFIGVLHPELFGYIGAVCPAPGLINGTGYPYQLEESEFCFNENPPYMLLISAAINDGVVGGSPAAYENMLTQNGTEHLWHTMSTTGHDASSVTPHLYNYFRVIFNEN